MFAYIRIVDDGPLKDKKRIVPVSDIKHFKLEKHKGNIKYILKSDDDESKELQIAILLLAGTILFLFKLSFS